MGKDCCVADAYKANALRPEPAGGKVSPPSGSRMVCAQPNCKYFCEMRADDRILKLRHLYAEYVDACNEAFLIPYSFKTFCSKLREWRRSTLSNEQPSWLPGEYMLTYWSSIESGAHKCWVFVAQMAFSGATFICRSDGRSALNWMLCCECAYRYFGGVPYITDCSVFGVSSSSATRCFRATLEGFATYYRTVLYGSRPKTGKTAEGAPKPLGPKNSSKALRNIRKTLASAVISSVEDIDGIVEAQLECYNKHACEGARARWDVLVERELPRMLALPEQAYDMATWDFRIVGKDYHFTLKQAKYSCSYSLVGQEVRIRYTDEEVLAYHGGEVVARHAILRKDIAGRRVSTDDAHRPNGHRWFARRMEFRFREMASVCGCATVEVMKVFLARCKAEGRGYRACKELIDLRHAPSAVSLEDACAQVLALGSERIDIEAIRKTMGVA